MIFRRDIRILPMIALSYGPARVIPNRVDGEGSLNGTMVVQGACVIHDPGRGLSLALGMTNFGNKNVRSKRVRCPLVPQHLLVERQGDF